MATMFFLLSLSHPFKYMLLMSIFLSYCMTLTMTKFILKINTSFEVYKRYIYVQNK